MIGRDLPCVLPTHDFDLRQYLEKHLMHKPHVLYDYDEINGNVQAAFEEKKLIDSATMLLGALKESIEYAQSEPVRHFSRHFLVFPSV